MAPAGGVSAYTLWRAVRRHWALALCGLVATVAVAVGVPARATPVYYAQTDAVFLPPGGNPDDATAHRDDLVAFAAAVERQVNGGRPAMRLSSASATLYGAGVRQGSSVVLPNLGSQWQNSFARPVLSVEVVDSRPERVRQVRAQLLERIRRASVALQAQQGVPADARITVGASPQTAVVEPVGASRAGRLRAMVALGVLGVGVTVGAVVAVDRRVGARRPAVGGGGLTVAS